ncbi:hypothetical protein WA158_001579 [Blastocystis sp. Blastoise]
MKSCFVFLALLALCLADTFDHTHIRFLEATPAGNYLFRMGMPKFNDTAYAYEGIREWFPKVAAEHGVVLPEDYYIIDISLLTSERSDVDLERTFFEAHPTLGRLINWPIHGLHLNEIQEGCKFAGIPVENCSHTQPRDYSPEDVKKIALQLPKFAMKDNLPLYFTMIRTFIDTPHEKPYVVFWHCECGCDRVGEVSASYVMQFQGWNFTEAMKWDEDVPKRHIEYDKQIHAQWYCEYLNAIGKTRIQDCGNCSPFVCN